jgi:type I restriction enzyme, S subunit
MVDEWKTARIEDLAEKVAIGPFGSSIKIETFVPTGVPVISGQHLHGTRVEDNGHNFISIEHAEKLKNSNVFRGDVIFTHAGNIGQAAYIPETSKYERYIISQRQFYMRCDRSKILPEFVTRYFKTPEGQHKLLANASSVGVPSIARPVSYLRTVEIPVPPLREQEIITQIFDSLDDKIELNQRINETLEALAQSLFKSWFVDAAQSALPKGWSMGKLTDIADIVMGLSPEGESYNTDGVGTPLINGPVEFGEYFPVKTKWTTSPTRMAQAGDLIFCVRGSTTGRRVISDDAYCLGRGVCGIRAKEGANTFLYQTVGFGLQSLLSKTTGSVFPSLSAPDIKGFPIVLPPPQVVARFSEKAEPLTEKIQANVRESRTLATLRDALLPKLLSGELRVPNIERKK